MTVWRSIQKDLGWTVLNEGVTFTTRDSLAVRLPLAANDASLLARVENLRAFQKLEELWAEGKLKQSGPGKWLLGFDEFLNLSDDDLQELNLPISGSVRLRVAQKGFPGKSGFGIRVEVEDRSLGRLTDVFQRIGPFFVISKDRLVCVPPVCYQLLKLEESGPSGRGLESHLEFLGKAQALGRRCGAHLDRAIGKESYHFPEKLDVEVEEHGPELLELRPRIRDRTCPPVDSETLLSRRVRKVYSRRRPHGGRDRIVFNERLQKARNHFRRQRQIRGSDVPRFLENPEAFLPPEIDLSEFSKRVKGLKTVVYNSRPYIHIRRDSGGWFEGVAGIQLESLNEPSEAGEREASVREGESDEAQAGTNPSVTSEEFRRLVQKAQQEGQEYVLYQGNWVRLNEKATREFFELFDRFDKTADGVLKIPGNAIFDIYENLEALEFELPPIERASLHFDWRQLPQLAIPEAFRGTLREHQEVGFRWMAYLDGQGTGGLLADDMGLGKTVQVIAHLTKLAAEGRLRPTLIVCPKTLIQNWQNELSRFFPSCARPAVFEGGPVSASAMAQCDVVVTSYDILRRNQFELGKVDWELVVTDEAQFAKNPTAQRTTALKAMKSRHRVALTGTPVENGLIEFWCIMDFVRPGLLGSWSDFRSDFERPLAQDSEESHRQALIARLLEKLDFHYLRREKKQVLSDLPSRHFHSHPVSLSPEQFELYRAIAKKGLSGGRGAALAAIQSLIQVCGHPHVLSGDSGWFHHRPGDCPKLDKTLEILEEIRNRGEKAVVFTRFKELQSILQTAIRETFNLHCSIINGEINSNRQQIVDFFSDQPDFHVLILSHDVGGVGLNITAANHVIHYTRPWNPAKENQATDRVYRIGQSKEVHVYYPVVEDDRFETVEKRLGRLLEGKASLARDVLQPSSEMTVGGDELLEVLENVASLEREAASPGTITSLPSTAAPADGRKPAEMMERKADFPRGGDGRVLPSETVAESPTPLPKVPAQEPLEIEEGETGHSYETLFLPYIEKARWVRLEDPYLRLPHQLRNFESFCSLLSGKTSAKEFELITKAGEPEELQNLRRVFEGFGESLREYGIYFSFKFSPTLHARSIKADSGWHIELDRGLDIFQKPSAAGVPPFTEQTRRRCKRTRIIYLPRQ